MVRRRLTLRRIDPWSVLKFGFVANLALLGVFLLGAAVVWFFVQRLGLIEAVCSAATEVGFSDCGIDGGNLFRALLLLGLLGVVVQTGLLVFLSFLHNLIADLVGGLTFGFVDETPGSAARGEVPARVTSLGSSEDSSAQRTGPPPPLGTTGPRPADRAARRQRDRAGSDASGAEEARSGVQPTSRRRAIEEPGEEPMFGDRTGPPGGRAPSSGS